MADAFDFCKEIRRWGEPYAALPECPSGRDLGLQFIVFAEKQELPDSDLSPRTYQALPFVGIARELAGQKNFNSSAQKIMCGRITGADGLRIKPARLP